MISDCIIADLPSGNNEKQLEVNPSGVGIWCYDTFPGRDPGYWKMTPPVSKNIRLKASMWEISSEFRLLQEDVY
jgi:hypothetical protein